MRGQFDYNHKSKMWNFIDLKSMKPGDGHKINKINIHIATCGRFIGEVYYTAQAAGLSGGTFEHLEDAIRWVEKTGGTK